MDGEYELPPIDEYTYQKERYYLEMEKDFVRREELNLSKRVDINGRSKVEKYNKSVLSNRAGHNRVIED